jgi:XTP/dITP diphosphohydrolase
VRHGSPLVLATGNAGKVREFSRLLEGAFEVRPLPSGVGLPAETGDTFATNARLKAESVFSALGGACDVLADDSGLEVAALGGRPGIFSARFAGEGATDADNVAKLLGELAGASDRSARFVCALCLVTATRDTAPGEAAASEAAAGVAGADPTTALPPAAVRVVEVRGETRGSITVAPRGDDGFGYDPVFVPEGWDQTLAQAPPEAKDRVSHRGAAARALLRVLAREGEA